MSSDPAPGTSPARSGQASHVRALVVSMWAATLRDAAVGRLIINIILASTPKILPNACASSFSNCWGQNNECCQGSYCDPGVGATKANVCLRIPPKPALKPTPKPAPKSCVSNGDYCQGQNNVCCQGLYCNHDSNTCGGCVEELSSCAHNDECCVGICTETFTYKCCTFETDPNDPHVEDCNYDDCSLEECGVGRR